MNSNFILLSKVQRTINYYNKILINYPKNEVILKQNIEKSLYDLIRYLFSYNINDTDRIKQKYLKDFLVELSMLDFYTHTSYVKKIIGKHQFEVLTNFILEIRKIYYGLVKNEKHMED